MSSSSLLYGVRLVNCDLTHWFSTEAEQRVYAARCGFEFVLVTTGALR